MVMNAPFDLGNPLLAELDAAGIQPTRMPRAEKWRAYVYQVADPEDAQGVLDDIEGLLSDPDESTVAELAAKRRASRVGPIPDATKPAARMPSLFKPFVDKADQAVEAARSALMKQEQGDAASALEQLMVGMQDGPKKVTPDIDLQAPRDSLRQRGLESGQITAQFPLEGPNELIASKVTRPISDLAAEGFGEMAAGFGAVLQPPRIGRPQGGGGRTSPSQEAARKAGEAASSVVVPREPWEYALEATPLGIAGDITRVPEAAVKGAKIATKGAVRAADAAAARALGDDLVTVWHVPSSDEGLESIRRTKLNPGTAVTTDRALAETIGERWGFEPIEFKARRSDLVDDRFYQRTKTALEADTPAPRQSGLTRLVGAEQGVIRFPGGDRVDPILNKLADAVDEQDLINKIRAMSLEDQMAVTLALGKQDKNLTREIGFAVNQAAAGDIGYAQKVKAFMMKDDALAKRRATDMVERVNALKETLGKVAKSGEEGSVRMPFEVDDLARASEIVTNAAKMTAREVADFAKRIGVAVSDKVETMVAAIREWLGKSLEFAENAIRGGEEGNIRMPFGPEASKTPEPVQGGLVDVTTGQVPDELKTVAERYPHSVRATFGGFAADVGREASGLIGAPLALKTTVSPAILRQGMVRLITKPRQALLETRRSITNALRETDARAFQQALEDHPMASRYNSKGEPSPYAGFTAQDAELKLRDWGTQASAESRAPEFQGIADSRIGRGTQKLPHVRFSDRQYALEFNAHALGRYSEQAQLMHAMGERDLQAYKDLARVIEHQLHYGSWKQGKIPVFFSTRAISGRAETMTDLFRMNPIDVRKPGAAREAWRGAIAMVAGNLGMMYLVAEALPGFDIEEGVPPKLKTPLGTIDPWAGFGSIARLVYDVGTLIEKDIGSGSLDDLGPDVTERVARFIRGQQAPVASKLTDIGTGKDFQGREYSLTKDVTGGGLLTDMVAPMLAESIVEGYMSYGPAGALAAGGIEGFSGSIDQSHSSTDLREQAIPGLIRSGILPPDATVDTLGSGEMDAVDRWLRENKPDAYKDAVTEAGGVFGDARRERAKIDAEYNEAYDRLLNDLKYGREPKEVQTALASLRSEQAGRTQQLYGAEGYREAVEGLPSNDLRKLEDQYFSKVEEVAAGRKTGELTAEDWDEIDKRQETFVASLPVSVRERFQKNLDLRDSVVEPPELLRLKREADTASEPYYELLDARDKAGKDYKGPAPEDWLRDNPDAEAKRWRFYGSTLHSAAAVNAVLPEAGERKVKMIGLERAVNETDGTVEAWAQFGERAGKFLNNFQVERDKERIASNLYGNELKRANKWDGQAPIWDLLTDGQRDAVTTRIRNGVRQSSPDLEAYLAWMGRYDTIHRTEEATLALRTLRELFGREPVRDGGPIRYLD